MWLSWDNQAPEEIRHTCVAPTSAQEPGSGREARPFPTPLSYFDTALTTSLQILLLTQSAPPAHVTVTHGDMWKRAQEAIDCYYFISAARIHRSNLIARAVSAGKDGHAQALRDLPCNSYLLHLGQAALGTAVGDKTLLLSICGLVHMKSLCITGKTRAFFISFGSRTVLLRSLQSRTTFLPGEMECLQAWKKKI